MSSDNNLKQLLLVLQNIGSLLVVLLVLLVLSRIIGSLQYTRCTFYLIKSYYGDFNTL